MIKRILVLTLLAAIVGLITLTGGEITKLFVKANRCHRTKLFLFSAGCITALLIALIGALYTKFVSSETQKTIYSSVFSGPEAFYYENELVDERSTNTAEELIENIE